MTDSRNTTNNKEHSRTLSAEKLSIPSNSSRHSIPQLHSTGYGNKRREAGRQSTIVIDLVEEEEGDKQKKSELNKNATVCEVIDLTDLDIFIVETEKPLGETDGLEGLETRTNIATPTDLDTDNVIENSNQNRRLLEADDDPSTTSEMISDIAHEVALEQFKEKEFASKTRECIITEPSIAPSSIYTNGNEDQIRCNDQVDHALPSSNESTKSSEDYISVSDSDSSDSDSSDSDSSDSDSSDSKSESDSTSDSDIASESCSENQSEIENKNQDGSSSNFKVISENDQLLDVPLLSSQPILESAGYPESENKDETVLSHDELNKSSMTNSNDIEAIAEQKEQEKVVTMIDNSIVRITASRKSNRDSDDDSDSDSDIESSSDSDIENSSVEDNYIHKENQELISEETVVPMMEENPIQPADDLLQATTDTEIIPTTATILTTEESSEIRMEVTESEVGEVKDIDQPNMDVIEQTQQEPKAEPLENKNSSSNVQNSGQPIVNTAQSAPNMRKKRTTEEILTREKARLATLGYTSDYIVQLKPISNTDFF